MPFANFKVPAGTLTAEQKEVIVHRATDLYAEIYGERARANTMILVEEVADGGWGIGDQVLTLAMLTASVGTANAADAQGSTAAPPES
jgi:4-oxalocrotonate tautomerase